MFEIRISGRKEGGERGMERGVNIVVGEADIVPCHFFGQMYGKKTFLFIFASVVLVKYLIYNIL